MSAVFRNLTTRFSIRRPQTVALCAVAGLLVFAACSKAPEVEPSKLLLIPRSAEQPIAIVDGKNVSGNWLFHWCATQKVVVEADGIAKVDDWSLIKAGRKLLVEMTLLANEAERLGITVPEEDIEKQLSEEMGRFESTKEWRDRLEQSRMTVEERRDQIRTELLFQRYTDEVLKPAVREQQVTPETLRAFYDKFGEELFSQEAAIRVMHLMRSAAKDAPDADRDRERQIITQARQRILGGEEFADVARELSTDKSALEGGDLGFVPASAMQGMIPELVEELKSLKEGQTSGIIETAHGFHLIQAAEVNTARVLSFDEVKADIENRVMREALMQATSQALQELRSAADIKYLDLSLIPGMVPDPNEVQDAAEQT